jgi:hypothetical protein
LIAGTTVVVRHRYRCGRGIRRTILIGFTPVCLLLGVVSRRTGRASDSTRHRAVGGSPGGLSARPSHYRHVTRRTVQHEEPPGAIRVDLGWDLSGGYYVEPTVFEGDNSMRIFQEEIFGPVVSVTRFDGFDDAIKIANDTLYGLGAGVWARDANTLYRAGRAIQAGRVWTNCYHAYPAAAAFGGYKGSGIGRENHLMMLDHYQQTKNLLVSYSPKKLGFF